MTSQSHGSHRGVCWPEVPQKGLDKASFSFQGPAFQPLLFALSKSCPCVGKVHLLIRSSVHLLIRSSIHLLIHSSIHLLIRSSIHSSTHSFIHLFMQLISSYRFRSFRACSIRYWGSQRYPRGTCPWRFTFCWGHRNMYQDHKTAEMPK